MTSAQNKNGRYGACSDQSIYVQNIRMIPSSKDNPCPVCDRTKDGDCAWTPDRGLILCYTEGKDGNPAQSAAGYHFNGKYSDSYHGSSTRAQYTKKKPQKRVSSSRPTQRFKPAKQEQRDINAAIVEVMVKVDDLALLVAEGYETAASAQVELAAWCKERKHDKYAASQLFKTKLKEASDQGMQGTSDEASRLVREYRLIEQQFGDRLRMNELLKEIELDGEHFDPAKTKLELNVTHGLSIKGNRKDLADSIVKLAKQNSYSPVGEYLKTVHQRHGSSTDILDSFAQRHLGTSDPIHDALLKRFLVAAVARVFTPGCKHDCALILQGPQGYFKSTFFKVLASESWFDDSLGSASDKDEKLKLHRSWIVEWAELETVFRRRDVSQVKAFMSSSIDILRPPYGESIETLKRASVIVGTTNQEQFLADTTGNRRFWVVPVTHPLDIAALRTERDHIWAAAVALYQAGEQWWLTKEESREVDDIQARYEAEDPWLDPVSSYVDGRPIVTTEEILTRAIDIEIGRCHTPQARRVADIMRKLGWEQTPNKVSHNGEKKRIWKPKFFPELL